MDYVQPDFSAARFSAYVWPTVIIGDATLRFGDRGYRDALCAFTRTRRSPQKSRQRLDW
jgi:hypothetical protein